jgi:hypothetical protein
MGKTFSGGKIEVGLADGTRDPLFDLLCDCDAADGRLTVGRGVEPVDGRFRRLAAAAVAPLCEALWPVGWSEDVDPSPGDLGVGPDIRSNETERGLEAPESADCRRLLLLGSAEEPISCSALRFSADLGKDG